MHPLKVESMSQEEHKINTPLPLSYETKLQVEYLSCKENLLNYLSKVKFETGAML